MNSEDYMAQQYQVAEQTNEFLAQWGLKQLFVADACQISRPVLSAFLNHRLALSKTQLTNLLAYMNDYRQRNG